MFLVVSVSHMRMVFEVIFSSLSLFKLCGQHCNLYTRLVSVPRKVTVTKLVLWNITKVCFKPWSPIKIVSMNGIPYRAWKAKGLPG